MKTLLLPVLALFLASSAVAWAGNDDSARASNDATCAPSRYTYYPPYPPYAYSQAPAPYYYGPPPPPYYYGYGPGYYGGYYGGPGVAVYGPPLFFGFGFGFHGRR